MNLYLFTCNVFGCVEGQSHSIDQSSSELPPKVSLADRKSDGLSSLGRSISPSVFVTGNTSGSNVSLTVEDLSSPEARLNVVSFGQSLGKPDCELRLFCFYLTCASFRFRGFGARRLCTRHSFSGAFSVYSITPQVD
jgi:hypothetical protein